jgi:hypothetical protein
MNIKMSSIDHSILANANCGTENFTLRAPRQQKTKTRPKRIQTWTRLAWRVDCKPRVAATAARAIQRASLAQPQAAPRQAGYIARLNTILYQWRQL